MKAGSLGVGDLDGFSFSGAAGEVITLLMTKVDGDLWRGFSLYGPDGIELRSVADPANAQLVSYRLTQNGRPSRDLPGWL